MITFRETRLAPALGPALAEHLVDRKPVLPGAGVVELILAAARIPLPVLVRDVVFLSPLTVAAPVRVRVVFEEVAGSAERKVEVRSHAEGPELPATERWQLNAVARIGPGAPITGRADVDAARARCTVERTPSEHYERLARFHLEYGPFYRTVTSARVAGDELVAELVLGPSAVAAGGRYTVHPAILDGALQSTGLLPGPGASELPFSFGELRIAHPIGARATCLLTRSESAGKRTVDFDLIAPDGTVLAQATRVGFRAFKPVAPASRLDEAGFFHEAVWTEVAPGSDAALPAGAYLLLGDGDALESAVVARLGAGFSFERVRRGEDLAARVQGGLRGAIHLWSAGAERGLDEELRDGPYAVAAAIKALAKQGAFDLRVLSTGARPPVSVPARAAVGGVVRVANLELERGKCHVLDAEPGSPDALADAFVREWRRCPGGGESIARGARVLEERLATAARTAPIGISERGLVLITGGVTGVGRVTARVLAERWRARLLLLSRRGFVPRSEWERLAAGGGEEGRAAAELLAVERAGGEIMVAPADAADRAQVARAIEEAERRFGPLRAVFHSAGALKDGLLRRLAPEDFELAFRPKLRAAYALHEACVGRRLDAFVLYSTASTVFGNPGQANYVAANAAIDAFADWRARATGEPTLAIDWTLWSERGLATWAVKDLEKLGVITLDDATGAEALRRALDLGGTRLVVANVPAKLAKAAPAAAARAPARDLVALVRQEVAEVLETQPARLDPDAGFVDLGVDSMLATTILQRIAKRLGVELKIADIFDYASIHALARHLASIAPAPPPASPEPARAAAPAPPEPVPSAAAPTGGVLLEVVRAAVAEVLECAPARVDVDAGFVDLGVDSMSATTILKSVGARIGAELRVADIFDYPSVRALAAHLARTHGEPAPAPQPSRATAPGARPPEDAIAIVGLACRFPGARDAKAFWELLREGRDAVGEVPKTRWDVDRWFDPDPEAPFRTYGRWGGFIDDLDAFDPAFFEISAREARAMDPQQRVMLEMAWHALEDAAATRLRGTRTGVFVGVSNAHYGEELTPHPFADAFTSLGNTKALIGNRISHALDLRGPSVMVDTLCSSSLVALDQARRAILSGQCEHALAGGVSLVLTPWYYLTLSRLRAISPTGRCRAFGRGADGFVPAEGAAFVVLKRLDAALRDGDPVRAVIRGSAVNHAGKASGLTVPTSLGQSAVIRAALDEARVDPATISYVEAHGTGTQLGDPVEVEGLLRVFSGSGARAGLGSVKSNIGHAESAAGIASLIKVVLALENQALPRTLHADPPNPHIDLAGTPFHLLHELEPWPRGDAPRRAGVSSFGLGGANAHVVVEEAPERGERKPSSGPALIVLSARSEPALRALRERLPALQAHLHDLERTLALGRAHFRHRFAAVVDRLEDLAAPRDGDTPLHQLARRYAAGEEIDLERALAGRPGRLVSLPGYPFERGRFWVETRTPAEPAPAPAAPDPRARDRIEDMVVELVAEAIGEPPGSIDRRASLREKGVDSIVAVGIVRGLERKLSCELSPALLFDHPSINDAVAFLTEEHGVTLAPREPAPPEPPTPEPARIEAASDGGAVAVIGMAGRFPGARSIDELWALLREGRSAITEVPRERFDIDAIWDPEPGKKDRAYARWGGFIEGVDRFDPAPFAITPREAEVMDPQQRWLLQVSLEALEDAGYAGRATQGRRVGVYVGASHNDYHLGLGRSVVSDPFANVGNHNAILANRISYAFDLHGPSETVDSLCSSALVAIHQAASALRLGDAELALAGGVFLNPSPKYFLSISSLRVASPTGTSRPFGAGADGYVPGEAVAMLVLKPLSRALADGDAIHGVIRGSAIGHAGHGSGLTAPSSAAQAEVVRRALERAGVGAETIGYVEAHGMSTALGDRLEVEGLTRAFGGGRAGSCPIGSIKSNIGHTEPASGAAGVIKALLAVKHGEIPPTLGADPPSPLIELARTPFVPATRLQRWPKQGVRRAGVSAFGLGGAYAHAIVEEAPAGEAPASAGRGVEVLPLSAATADSLRELARRVHDALPAASLADLAHTLAAGRAHFDHRLAVTASSTAEASAALGDWLAGRPSARVFEGRVPESGRVRVAALFPASCTVVAPEERAYAEALARFGTPASDAERTLAAQVALHALWRSWGLTFDTVAGEGAGAMAAGVVEGALTPDQARRGLREGTPESHAAHAPRPDADVVVVLGDRPAWLRDVPAAVGATPEALARLYTLGADIDWVARDEGRPLRRVHAPTYPFRAERHWRSAPTVPDSPLRADAPTPAPAPAQGTTPTPLAELLHEERWAPRPLAEPGAPLSGRWLLLEDAVGVSAAVRRLVPEVELVPVREVPDDRAAERLLEGVEGVLHLAACGGRPMLTPMDEVRRAFDPLFLLAKQLARARRPLGLRVLTANAQVTSADDAPIDPNAAAIWGLARTLKLEAPQVALHLLDAALPADPERVAQAFVEEWRARTEGEHAHRRGLRLARGFAPRDEHTAVPALPEGAVVLVAGGLGAIGSAIAEWLASTRKARIVVLQRGALPPPGSRDPKLERARRIEAAGGALEVLSADVADPRDAVRRARARWGRIDAVVHACGFSKDALLPSKRLEDAHEVMRPKIAGVRALDEATAEDEPLMILCGSIAGALGNPGQADYAAANAYLRAYASFRTRALERRTLCVEWSAWREGGMAAHLGAALERAGVVPLSTGEGIAALSALLDAGAEAAIAGRFRPPFPIAELHERPPAPRDAGPLDRVREVIGAALKMPPDQLPVQRELRAIGVDSILAVEVSGALSASFAIDLPPTEMFDHPTIARLAARVGELARRSSKPAPARRAPTALSESEPIAIVSMACRFAGARDPESYWTLLREGRSVITEVPKSRWDASRWFDPEPGKPGKIYCKWGSFVEDLDRFDPLFFNIAPAEAKLMDPQQRVLLELAWETAERAGYAADLRGSRTGVFVGSSYENYARTLPAELHGDSSYALGNSLPLTANRISYTFDLSGPSLFINTMCSSGLVAVDAAVRSLRAGQCDVALAGAAHLCLTPAYYVSLCSLRAVSPRGRSAPFGAGADGFVPGEGAGLVMLKPLSAAERDGDRVLGLIRGSAVNHGGHGNGISAPNADKQAAVIRAALAEAGVGASTIGYVEAHGTGTLLGDPVEVRGLTEAFSDAQIPRGACGLGSVKSNIGHTEPAAGIAGLIKLALALGRSELPPTLNAGQVNPLLRLEETPFRLVRTAEPWERNGAPRRAGVSSFGLGGTNAHVILEEGA